MSTADSAAHRAKRRENIRRRRTQNPQKEIPKSEANVEVISFFSLVFKRRATGEKASSAHREAPNPPSGQRRCPYLFPRLREARCKRRGVPRIGTRRRQAPRRAAGGNGAHEEMMMKGLG